MLHRRPPIPYMNFAAAAAAAAAVQLLLKKSPSR